VAPAGQLSELKFELQLSNQDKPASGSEIRTYGSERNYKLQAPPDLKIGPNKSQISISNDQNIQRGCTVSLPKFLFTGNHAIWHKCRRITRLGF
jgi:hypothetical protein